MIPGRWLAPVRTLVLAWILVTLVILVWSLPSFYESRRHLEGSALSGSAFSGWTTEQLKTAAAEMGLKPDLAAGTLFVANIVCLISFWVVGGLLFWRRSNTWMGLLAAYSFIATGPGFSNLPLTQTQIPEWAKSLYSLNAIFSFPTLFVILLYLFPTGQFVPRFTRYLAVAPYLLFGVQLIVPSGSPVLFVLLLLLFAYLLGGLISQIYRYHRISRPEARQQTKWVVFALGLLISQVLFNQLALPLIPALAIGTSARFLYELILNGIVGYLIPALIPLSIGMAILRYRLWDIDLIIRRTLVYAVLTALLALAYFGSVVVLQNVFSALTGQSQSTLVTVLSTLVIAALFGTLRRRVQTVIDRRLYRRKYDAVRTLAAFGANVRDEVNLDDLTDGLLGVVDETLQPVSASLWLSGELREPRHR